MKFIWRRSRGSGEAHAQRLLEAAKETLALWDGELDFTELADDIAVESPDGARALEGDQRARRATGGRVTRRGSRGHSPPFPESVSSMARRFPLARRSHRFASLAGVRSFSGLVPKLSSSGLGGRHGGPTKSGDAALREALYMAANRARRIDPTLAQRYHRLMVNEGKHHNSALCT